MVLILRKTLRLIGFALAVFSAWAAFSLDLYAKEFRDVMTYEEFESLLKSEVSRMPVLRGAFEATQDGEVFFAGGGLRGLLHLLHEIIQTHSLAEIRRMPGAQIHELIQNGADQDLFVRDPLVANVLREWGYGSWDLLPADFIRASRAAGGATIEKVGVSPKAIDDPFGALRDYYDGKLTFRAVPDEVFKSPELTKTLINNSRTALALRFARFVSEMPEAKPTEESKKAISELVRREVGTLESNNYWVNKALHKLYLSNHCSLPRMVGVLNGLGMMDVLLDGHYHDRRWASPKLESGDEADIAALMAGEKDHKAKLKMLRAMWRYHFFADKGESGLMSRLLVHAAREARSYDELLEVMQPVYSQYMPRDAWAVGGFVKDHPEEFLKLKPSKEQIAELRKKLIGKARLVLAELELKVAQTSSEVIEIVRSAGVMLDDQSQLHWQASQRLVELDADLDAIRAFQSMNTSSAAEGNILDAGIRRAKSLDEVRGVLSYRRAHSEFYRRTHAEAIARGMGRIQKMKPDLKLEEMIQLLEHLDLANGDPDDAAGVSLFPLIKTRDDLKLYRSRIRLNSREARDQLKQWVDSHHELWGGFACLMESMGLKHSH